MRLFALIVSILAVSISSYVLYFIFSFINYVNNPNARNIPIYFKSAFSGLKEKLQGKNYIQKNNKLYIVSNYIITPTTLISWVVEVNGKKKNFKNMTLQKLASISEIWKIYITKIWDIQLKWYITISNYTNNSIIYGDVKEENKETSNKK